MSVGTRVLVFDKLQDVGMRLEECGRAFQKLSIHFPATHKMLREELEECKRVCNVALKALASQSSKTV